MCVMLFTVNSLCCCCCCCCCCCWMRVTGTPLPPLAERRRQRSKLGSMPMPNFCARLRNFFTAQSWAGRRTSDDANATGTCEALRRGKGGGSDKGSGRDDFEDGGVVDVALVLAVRCSALRYASATRSPAWPLQRIRRRLPQHFAAVRFPRPREPQPRVCWCRKCAFG